MGHIRAKAKSIIAKAKHGQSLRRKSKFMHGIGGANEITTGRKEREVENGEL